MRKLSKKPIKSSIILIVTAALATLAHNAVYAVTKVEEPFFFSIAIVSVFSIPIVIIIYLVQKFTTTSNS
jgi:hypothetical protein